ncbi:MAG: metallophosphoesterase [Acutalibacteraceae bacterium]|nr:metallophosphoesterase [Acutalibacteraceae bacterium]
MKILHTADLHIGAELSYLSEKSEERKYEVLEVFKNITSLCRKNGVEICLIAGDLFDSNAAGRLFAAPVFRAIEEASETRFFLVAGNHDPLDASSPFSEASLPENLTVFGTEYETIVLDDLKVRITGRSFAHSSMEFCDMPPMENDEYLNILLLHSEFGAAGSVYNPISSSFAENCGADYIALGHIHKRTKVEKIGNSYIAYPGCPEGQGFDEAGVKGVYMGELTKDSCKLDFTVCSKRIHLVKTIDLGEVDSTAQAEKIILHLLEEEFGQNFRNNLYKLILTGKSVDPAAVKLPELTAALREKLYFVKLKSRIGRKLDLDLLAKEFSLKGIFVRRFLERIKDANEADKAALTEAMNLGLEAFETEVGYLED